MLFRYMKVSTKKNSLIVVTEVARLAAEIWAHLGWKDTVGRADITKPISLTKPVTSSLRGFLCE